MACAEDVETDKSYGVVNHTLVVPEHDATQPPPEKLSKMHSTEPG